MTRRSSPALLSAVAVGAVALSPAPAGASEGPLAPPPRAPLLPGLAPPLMPAFPGQPALKRAVRSARVLPHRIRRGGRARVVVVLRRPSRLRIVLSRRVHGRRVTVAVVRVPARKRMVVVRLPRRVHGHRLRAGRYRVRVVAIDAAGTRARPVDRRLVVGR